MSRRVITSFGCARAGGVFATGPIGGRTPDTSPIVLAPAGRTLSGERFTIDQIRCSLEPFGVVCRPWTSQPPAGMVGELGRRSLPGG
jgi:hypothetical protein